MRCALRPISRIAGDVLTIVLILAAAPIAGAAQSLVCHPIRAGESATQVARRITGQSRNTGQAWFQIMNASAKFVPKSQYDRVRAGWRACIPETAVERASATADQVKSVEVLDTFRAPEAPAAEALATPTALVSRRDIPQPAGSGVFRAIGNVDLTIVWLGTAVVVSWAGWRVFDGYSARRSTASIVVTHFAARFVQEFERPLVQRHPAEHAVRSGLRRTRRGRFDILLAPGAGRRYPNLSDHKKNVEYDVARVLRLLADESFVSGPLYTQAGWVVVPFHTKIGRSVRLQSDHGPAGVTCISSF
jgi:hypothetical protein